MYLLLLTLCLLYLLHRLTKVVRYAVFLRGIGVQVNFSFFPWLKSALVKTEMLDNSLNREVKVVARESQRRGVAMVLPNLSFLVQIQDKAWVK